jgi:hypothetical protein
MQHGDLETWSRQRVLVILEGVLATVSPVIETHRWKRDETVGWNIEWHDLALKRLANSTRRFHDIGWTVVTFQAEEVRDQAADMLAAIPIDVEAVEYSDYRQFCSRLRFQSDVIQVVDSDSDRLSRFGQLGRQVVSGEDWG